MTTSPGNPNCIGSNCIRPGNRNQFISVDSTDTSNDAVKPDNSQAGPEKLMQDHIRGEQGGCAILISTWQWSEFSAGGFQKERENA